MQVGQGITEQPTPEAIWAILRENAVQLKEIDRIVKETIESQKETDRIVKETTESQKETSERQKEIDRILKETAESQKETARQMEKTDRQMKETDRQIKDFNKRFGDFTNRFGEVVEYMLAPNLHEKFKEIGLNFPQYSRNTDLRDYENNIFLEIDISLHNGEKAMLVEVKTKLTIEDIKEHEKRLEKMRIYADLHGDSGLKSKRVFLGAVAGVVMTPQAKKYALGQGFYLIEPSGETVSITAPYGKPKEW
jgi:hypothetical protein